MLEQRDLISFSSKSMCQCQGLQNPKPPKPPLLTHGESMLETKTNNSKAKKTDSGNGNITC